MKHIRSYIFVVITLILILLLFTACIQIMPQPADDTTDDSVSLPEETTQEGINPQVKETTNKTETEDEPIATDSQQVSVSPSPQHTTYTTEAGVVELFIGEPVLVDLDGAGVMTEIEIIDADGALVLLSTQEGFEHHIFIANIPTGYLTNAYFVMSCDGYPFVVVSYDYCSDDYETSVFTFSGFEPSGNFKLPIAVYKINEYSFSTYGYIYAIGTWAAGTTAYFVNDTIEWRGTFVLDTEDELYMKDLRIKMDLPVQCWDDDGFFDSVLPSGTVLNFLETDAESYIKFILKDGREGFIRFEWDSDWVETIDDLPAYEYFEELPLFD